MSVEPGEADLSVEIGRLRLSNPVMAASGTFGNVLDCYRFHWMSKLGAIVPKTVTLAPRAGNAPPRTVETASGLLNSIGLDNDGLDVFLASRLPDLCRLGPPVILSIAAKSEEEFVTMARRLAGIAAVRAIELNLSCPNVAGGIDFTTDPKKCFSVLQRVRCVFPGVILAKLTPNITNIAEVAVAAEQGGAGGITGKNTLLGVAGDWRKRCPRLGGGFGGLSGPAIKPVALRVVYQIAQAVSIPVVAAGGIATVDDAMDFFVAGAAAIQVGTASFYRPTAAWEILQGLPSALAEIGANSVKEIVKSLRLERKDTKSEETASC